MTGLISDRPRRMIPVGTGAAVPDLEQPIPEDSKRPPRSHDLRRSTHRKGGPLASVVLNASTPVNGVSTHTLPPAVARAALAAKVAADNKGTHVVVLDMRELTRL